jgi:hypothetical protein
MLADQPTRSGERPARPLGRAERSGSARLVIVPLVPGTPPLTPVICIEFLMIVFHPGLNLFCIYLPDAAQGNVLFDAACFVFCSLVNVFLLHQVLDLFDFNKLTSMI